MYDKLLSYMKLSDEHREELRTKRGLTDATIDKFGFVSAIPRGDADAIRTQLVDEYGEDSLKEAHILLTGDDVREGKCKEGDLTYTVVGDRIVVPFFDEGKCVYLRQHKFGLPNTTPHIYKAENEESEELIITEGEFKAAALNQIGYSAIASPGITMFGGKNFPTLEEYVVNSAHTNVYIMFDGEIKNNPRLKSYKPKKETRWDTDFWAWKMCRMLESSGRKVNVVVWPKTWLIDGKIDPDAALAAGKTREDFDGILSVALTHKEFKDSWVDEQKTILDMKVKRDQFRSKVFERGGEYYKRVRVKGGEEEEFYDKRLGNFTLRIVAKHQTFDDNGDASIVREVEFVSSDGSHSRRSFMSANNFSTAGQFVEFAASKGDYQWLGSSDELRELVAKLYIEQDVKDCEQPLRLGRIDDKRYPGTYMGDVCYTDDGKYIMADDDGGFWRDGVYVKPDSLVQGNVAARTPIKICTSVFDWRKELEHMCTHYGSYAPQVTAMWMLGSLLSDDFFTAYGKQGSFPLMFVGGRFSSGKTTVVSQCMNFLGMGDMPSTEIDGTTIVGIGRMLAYHSCLPVWVDETRNNGKTEKAQTFFRNVWNRAAAFKGLRNTTKVRAVDTKGTLILSGQSLPTDAAFNERFVKVFVSSKTRSSDPDSFKRIGKSAGSVSYATHEVLTDTSIRKELVATYQRAVEEINDVICNDRVARNYGVVLAMAELLGIDCGDYTSYVYECAGASHGESEQLDESSEFLHDMSGWFLTERVNPLDYFVTTPSDEIHMAFNQTYNKYKEIKRRRGEDTFEKKALESQLWDRGVVIDRTKKYMGKTQVRTLHLDTYKIPEELRDYILTYYTA